MVNSSLSSKAKKGSKSILKKLSSNKKENSVTSLEIASTLLDVQKHSVESQGSRPLIEADLHGFEVDMRVKRSQTINALPTKLIGRSKSSKFNTAFGGLRQPLPKKAKNRTSKKKE